MIRTSIAGVTYRNITDQVAFRHLEEGEQVFLAREPTNEYDPNAIKVVTRAGHHIGYVPKKHCIEVLAHYEECRATFTGGYLQIEWGALAGLNPLDEPLDREEVR